VRGAGRRRRARRGRGSDGRRGARWSSDGRRGRRGTRRSSDGRRRRRRGRGSDGRRRKRRGRGMRRRDDILRRVARTSLLLLLVVCLARGSERDQPVVALVGSREHVRRHGRQPLDGGREPDQHLVQRHVAAGVPGRAEDQP
jgi:hypothetical protein